MDEQQDYYTNRGAKIADFCLGFFGLCLLAILGGVIGGTMNPGSQSMWVGILAGFLIITLGGILYFLQVKRRRYVAIGMISVIAVPALLAGTCALFFLGGGR